MMQLMLGQVLGAWPDDSNIDRADIQLMATSYSLVVYLKQRSVTKYAMR